MRSLSQSVLIFRNHWAQNYVNKNNYSNLAIDKFLRVYAKIVNEFMKLVGYLVEII